jgi:hypothetical protein
MYFQNYQEGSIDHVLSCHVMSWLLANVKPMCLTMGQKNQLLCTGLASHEENFQLLELAETYYVTLPLFTHCTRHRTIRYTAGNNHKLWSMISVD